MADPFRDLLQRMTECSTAAEQLRCEQELIEAVRLRLCRILLTRHVPPQDHEDVVQSILGRIIQALRDGRLTIHHPERFVFRCGTNAARDYFRRQARQRTIPTDPFTLAQQEDRPMEDPWQSSCTEGPDDQELLEQALASPDLPATYRRCILHVRAGRPIEELARELLAEQPRDRHGVDRSFEEARNQADAQLSRARRWLKARIVLLRQRQSN